MRFSVDLPKYAELQGPRVLWSGSEGNSLTTDILARLPMPLALHTIRRRGQLETRFARLHKSSRALHTTMDISREVAGSTS